MKLKTLSIFTSVLFIASIFVFYSENKRGTDLLAGSDYIKGLDVSKIQKINLSFKDGKIISLARDSDKFVLENHKSYPAATDKVNDLIYKIASIKVKEKVASNVRDELLKGFELDDKSAKYKVELIDNNDKKIIAFRVGKSQKGGGNYLLKDGKEDVYLSESSLWLNSSYKDFINTALLEVGKDEIEKVSLKTDKSLEIVRKNNEFVVEIPKGVKYNKKNVEEFTSSFSDIRFEDFYPLTETRVQGLNYNKDIKIKLKSNLVYKMSFARDKENYFLKLSALLEDTPSQFVVKQDDEKDELKKIENTIKAQGKAQRINMEKGAWVYKVDQSTYNKIVKESKYFL